MRFFLIFALCTCTNIFAAQPARDLPLDEIVRRSCERQSRNLDVRRQYTWKMTEDVRQVDKAGQTKERKLKTVEVLYIDGTEYRRVIGKDGHPLPAREAAEEEEKMDREMAKRKNDSERTRRKRVDEEHQELEEERRMRLEVPKAYDFTLLGEEAVNGRMAWKVRAEPKAGYQPSGKYGKILPKLHGTIWIDQQDYEWARIDAESLDTITAGLGVFRIGKGFRLRYDQEYLNQELWVPKTARIQASARALFLIGGNFDVAATFYDYRKYSVDSTVVAVSEGNQ